MLFYYIVTWIVGIDGNAICQQMIRLQSVKHFFCFYNFAFFVNPFLLIWASHQCDQITAVFTQYLVVYNIKNLPNRSKNLPK